MEVNITARHLELTPALKEYAEKRLQHVKKLTNRITTANIVLNVERDRHIAEITIGVSKNKINAKAIAGDMYSAMDFVVDKVVKQLKRHLEKLKNHKVSQDTDIWENIEESEGSQGVEDLGEPELDEVREFKIKKQSMREALSAMEVRDLNFWVFKDMEDSISVIYKRKDGKYGMLIVR